MVSCSLHTIEALIIQYTSKAQTAGWMLEPHPSHVEVQNNLPPAMSWISPAPVRACLLSTIFASLSEVSLLASHRSAIGSARAASTRLSVEAKSFDFNLPFFGIGSPGADIFVNAWAPVIHALAPMAEVAEPPMATFHPQFAMGESGVGTAGRGAAATVITHESGTRSVASDRPGKERPFSRKKRGVMIVVMCSRVKLRLWPLSTVCLKVALDELILESCKRSSTHSIAGSLSNVKFFVQKPLGWTVKEGSQGVTRRRSRFGSVNHPAGDTAPTSGSTSTGTGGTGSGPRYVDLVKHFETVKDDLEAQGLGKSEADVITTVRINVEEVVKQTLPDIQGRVLIKSKVVAANTPQSRAAERDGAESHFRGGAGSGFFSRAGTSMTGREEAQARNADGSQGPGYVAEQWDILLHIGSMSNILTPAVGGEILRLQRRMATEIDVLLDVLRNLARTRRKAQAVRTKLAKRAERRMITTRNVEGKRRAQQLARLLVRHRHGRSSLSTSQAKQPGSRHRSMMYTTGHGGVHGQPDAYLQQGEAKPSQNTSSSNILSPDTVRIITEPTIGSRPSASGEEEKMHDIKRRPEALLPPMLDESTTEAPNTRGKQRK